MNRILIFFVLFWLSLSCSSQKELPASDNFDVHQVANGVYALIHKVGGKAISNAGLIDLGDHTIVFDTFLSAAVAEEIPGVIKELNLSPVAYVINSHWHDDHIRGNQVFADDIHIISTTRTMELIKKNEPENLAFQKDYAPKMFAYYDSLLKAFTGDTASRAFKKILMWRPYYQVLAEENNLIKTHLPDMFVDQEKTIAGSQRSVKLFAKGSGHTESDLILYLPKEKIVFTGDLVFIGMHPYLADGNTDHLKEWLTFVADLGVDRVIPGHGPVGNAKDLIRMAEYITALEKEAEDLIEKKWTPDKAKIPEPYQQWWFERFFEWNMTYVYSNLKEKK